MPAANAHRHSALSVRLYCETVEAEMLFQGRLSYMEAWATLQTHPQVDPEGAGEKLRGRFLDAHAVFPFFTGGATGEDAQQQDREAAVKRYKAYKDRVLQGNKLQKRVEKDLHVKTVGANNAD